MLLFRSFFFFLGNKGNIIDKREKRIHGVHDDKHREKKKT